MNRKQRRAIASVQRKGAQTDRVREHVTPGMPASLEAFGSHPEGAIFIPRTEGAPHSNGAPLTNGGPAGLNPNGGKR